MPGLERILNIKEAKTEIIHTVQAYLDKDETGAYTIPPERQRPILLMGPPGIGKTAIMEQVAEECGIGLVSYTITHHTRQSAIGLPFISRRMYGEKEYSVTEYTMSEIIASVYDQIEASGIKEGILFLDEINCVSETLAPTMLQFLQYKTFGAHRVPDGFLIVTAGNPPQYNKSVRDFDIVTLDRLRRIDIEEDFPAFKEYASRAGLHGSVMAYLGIRNNHFYSIRTEVEGRHFVTARGWEDLSRTIQVHEKRNLPVDEELIVQFLQDPEIARSFAAYYDLYKKYKDVYRVPDILEGRFFPGDEVRPEGMASAENASAENASAENVSAENVSAENAIAENAPADAKGGLHDRAGQPEAIEIDPVRIQEMKDAPFDEKLSLISLLIDALSQSFAACARDKAVQETIMKELGQVRIALKEADASAVVSIRDAGAAAADERSGRILSSLRKKKETGIPIPHEQERIQRLVSKALDELAGKLREKSLEKEEEFSPGTQYGMIRSWFADRESERLQDIRTAGDHLTNTFRFLSRVYGDGQEMVLFLTELSAGYHSLRFINEHGNEAYFRYNRMLLLRDRRNALRDEVLSLME